MTVQELLNRFLQFINICAVYYVIQLVRCALLSFVVFAFVFALRKTLMKNNVFLKGALWSLFIPVLFIGKMKFFYENIIGVRLFWWCTAICMNNIWICRLYMGGILIYALFIFRRKRKLKKMTKLMEKKHEGSDLIYVTDAPVTPSAIGVFKPRIVMPRIILEEYDKEEIRTILLHEKTHIRLGHLVFYFLWDIIRILLWINPFLTIGMKLFREDMEEICDRVTIKRNKADAYGYGRILLKSMRVLQEKSEDFNMYATFSGDREYCYIRKRVTGIAEYKPYKKYVSVGTMIGVILFVAGTIFGIHRISYDRCNPYDSIAVYDMSTGEPIDNDSEALKAAVNFDEKYVYVEAEFLQELVRKSETESENICFFCGGGYKLPGIGYGGGFSYVSTDNLQDGIYKMVYEEPEDIFIMILKLL